MGGVVLRAGRSAVPYLMRQRRWDEAQIAGTGDTEG